MMSVWNGSADLQCLKKAIDYFKVAADRSPEGGIQRQQFLHDVAASLRQKYVAEYTLQDLLDAKSYYERAIYETPVNDRLKPIYYNNFALTLQDDYDHTRRTGAVDEGIALLQDVFESFHIALPTPQNRLLFHNLGTLLCRRFEIAHVRADINDAVCKLQLALQPPSPDNDPDRPVFTADLAKALDLRFDAYGSISDADEAIKLYRGISESPTPSHDFRVLHDYPNLLIRRAMRSGGPIKEMEEAISLLKRGLASPSLNSENRKALLNCLGAALSSAFDRTGDLQYINEAIEQFQNVASDETNPHRKLYLGNLGDALLSRFESMGDWKDLLASISTCEKALATPGPVTDDDGIINCLGKAYKSKFRRTGHESDLNKSVEYYESIVSDRPKEGTRTMYLNNFANTLQLRYGQTGSGSDISRAINLFHKAFSWTPKDDPTGSMYIAGIANSLFLRYQMQKSVRDLNESIVHLRKALDATLKGHPALVSRFYNLGQALLYRFRVSDNAKDLNQAVQYLKTAQTCSSNSGQIIPLINLSLGIAFFRLYESCNSIKPLDEAIKCYEAAEKDATDSLLLSTILQNLGAALGCRSELTKTPDDIRKELSVKTRAVEMTTLGEPLRSDRSLILAATYLRIHNLRLSIMEESPAEAALRNYEIAAFQCKTAKASTRILAAIGAATLREEIDPNPDATISLISFAVELLPEAITIDLDPSDQMFIRRDSMYFHLSANATSLCLKLGAPPELALRLFEIGRGVVLGHMIDGAAAIGDMEGISSALAHRFSHARAVLFPNHSRPNDCVDVPPADLFRVHRKAAFEDYNQALAEIRSIPKFREFLAPPTFAQLAEYGVSWPVVAINIHERRCDALIIRSTGVTALPLPLLKFDEVVQQLAYLRRALDIRQSAELESHKVFESVMKWLWYSAAAPILEFLGYVKPPAEGERWNRICWILGGLLSFFPVHASGDYKLAGETGDPCTVLDRVQSSYSPTFKAVVHALRQARTFECANTNAPAKSLIITMENTPEFPDDQQLRKSREEQEAVAKHLGTVLSVKNLTNPTRKQVLANAADYEILHFNCHGVSDRIDPSKSRLLIKDWKRNPLTFRDISHLHLDGCRLVYLSACETARNNDIGLSDEGIHVASGFQLAGVPSVIGTLWQIYEDDSLKMAEMVYSYLVESEGIGFERLADAVHEAVHCLRDGGKRPLDWGSYLLYGV